MKIAKTPGNVDEGLEDASSGKLLSPYS